MSEDDQSEDEKVVELFRPKYTESKNFKEVRKPGEQPRPTEVMNKDPKAKTKLPNRHGQASKIRDEDIVLTPKQEMYAKYRAEGYTKTQAYRMSNPDDKNPGPNSYHLENNNEKVAARIEQLRKERAWAAKLVDPQESLARWNMIYLKAMEDKDIKTAIEAQKQIDKINGAEASVVRQQLEVKGLFRGDDEDDWKINASRIMEILQETK